MSFRIIEGPEDLVEGSRWLAQADPRLAAALEECAPLPLRREPDGFETLMRAIVGQQLSTASAHATMSRLVAAGFNRPEALTRASDETLRAAGLSRSKIRYLRGIAAGGVDWQGLRQLPDEEAVAVLTALPGVGRWTAEIYTMFALGRADAIAAGDLALQESARLLLGLDERPNERAFRQIAAPWSPWRGVAARMLWVYYRKQKGREGMP